MKKGSIDRIFKLLVKEYGYRQWHSRSDPISELVQTILSQNTSDVNSHRAFGSLLASFPDWQDIVQANLKAIAVLEPAYIQFGSAEWFWERCVNSYILQVEPERSKYKDSVNVSFKEGLFIEKIRDQFFIEFETVIQKHQQLHKK